MVRSDLSVRMNEVLKTSNYLFLNAAIASSAGFVFWTFMSRTLLPSEIGLISTVTTTAGALSTLAGLGLSNSLIRFMPASRNKNGFWTWILLTVSISSAIVSFIWVVAQPIAFPELTSQVSGLTLSTVLATLVLSIAVDTLAGSVLMAIGKTYLVLLGTAITSVLKLFAACTFETDSQFLVAVAIISATGALISVAGAFWKGLRLGKPSLDSMKIARFAFSNWASASVSLIPKASLIIMIGSFLGLSEVAWVTVPVLILTALNLPASTLSRGLFTEGSIDSTKAATMAKKTFWIAFTVTSSAAISVSLSTPFLLSFLGQEYVSNSSNVLRIFCLAAVLAVPNYLIDTALNIRKDTTGYMIANVGGSVLILICLLTLVPYGVEAASWGWVLGQICYCLLALLVLLRNRIQKQH